MYAQKSKPIKNSQEVTASLLISKPSALVLSYNYYWHLGKSKKLALGLGARLTSSFGNNVDFITAPAKITSGKSGPGVFFASNIPANIDSINLSSVNSNSLNASINFKYSITKKLSIAFNIDALGISIGGNQNGVYTDGGKIAFNAKPTTANVLLISDNDIGSLNSELVGIYKFNKNWGIRLGAGFLFTEYTTSAPIQTTPTGLKNDRFRNKTLGLIIGTSYSF
jgi:hypothetical protein